MGYPRTFRQLSWIKLEYLSTANMAWGCLAGLTKTTFRVWKIWRPNLGLGSQALQAQLSPFVFWIHLYHASNIYNAIRFMLTYKIKKLFYDFQPLKNPCSVLKFGPEYVNGLQMGGLGPAHFSKQAKLIGALGFMSHTQTRTIQLK